MRVYPGSFWEQPYRYAFNSQLFEDEERALVDDILRLPAASSVRKINELLKRTTRAKVHALILAHLREQMPALMGKSKKQRALLASMLEQWKARLICLGEWARGVGRHRLALLRWLDLLMTRC